MSLFSDLGNGLVQAITGQDPSQLQAQLTSAEQQITVAVETSIALQFIITIELFIVMVMLLKERH